MSGSRFPRDISEARRAVLVASGIKSCAIGKAAGVHRAFVHQMKSGRRPITDYTWPRIEAALKELTV